MQPVSVVEDEGLQSLLNVLDPRYQLPFRKSTMQMLPEAYNKKVEEIKKEISLSQVTCGHPEQQRAI